MQGNEPVVPVFGPYFNGNFGDDLMGHLIASCLKDAGYRPKLWRGPDNSFRGRKWDTASNMKDFLKGARCVVFGGGLPFCNSSFTPYWKAIDEMVDECERLKIPIIAISVGSHGHHDDLHPVATKLVESPLFTAASLRLKVDVDWLKSKGKDVEYHPDIVLTAMQYNPRKEFKNILLCMAVGKYFKPFARMMVFCLRMRGYSVSTIGQFADGFPRSERYFHGRDTKVENTGPDSVVKAIGHADIVVASGLHIGITGLSGGAEFAAYWATGKTTSFMEQCGRSKQVVPRSCKIAKPLGFYRLYKVLTGIGSVDNKEFSDMVSAAKGHCDFMLKRLAPYYK